jgi:hypothetical protein
VEGKREKMDGWLRLTGDIGVLEETVGARVEVLLEKGENR